MGSPTPSQHTKRLNERETHILGWLLAYPASSTAEIATAFGIHRTTAYRALFRIQDMGLVTALAGYGGEARFLLTEAFTTLLAQGMHGETNEQARTWQQGLNSPARLIPRLVTIDRVHTFARGFFQHAPVQLAKSGHAAVVRWHLVRDWWTKGELRGSRASTVRAEAALAWTVEESRAFGLSAWVQASMPPRAEQWEAAFVLVESGFTDADRIWVRIAHLLALRSAPVRWKMPVSVFPPVLILVENERQIEVWRRVARHAARNANASPLCGAIVVQGISDNPWHWGWRDLSTGVSIRLASLFAPLPEEALPPGTLAHIAAVRELLHAAKGLDLTARPRRSVRPAQLPAVLAPRDRDLLTLLCRAPLMTTEEMAAVRSTSGHSLCGVSTERALRDLARVGLAERKLVVQGNQALARWRLTDRGLRTVASIHDVPILHLGRVAQHAQGAKPTVIEERDRFIHERQSQHLAGVYGVLAAFCRAAQQTRGAITVRWWDVGRSCERTYWYHGSQRNLRPDAELELAWTVEGHPRHLRCWIEYDRGTMKGHDLDRKMGAYAAYWESKEWAADGYTTLPRLLFIMPDPGQERRVREACQRRLGEARLRVLTTTVAHLEAETPFGHVWRQVWPELAASEQGKRRALWE